MLPADPQATLQANGGAAATVMAGTAVMPVTAVANNRTTISRENSQESHRESRE